MKHQWESGNKIQSDGKVIAFCKNCKLQGQIIWRLVYPMDGSQYPIPDNCSVKKI